jgi:hypothetical protein
VDSRAGLDDMKRKFLNLLGLEPVASRYTDCGIPAPYVGLSKGEDYIAASFQSDVEEELIVEPDTSRIQGSEFDCLFFLTNTCKVQAEILYSLGQEWFSTSFSILKVKG